MAKVQTRRGISFNRDVYDRIRAHCEAKGISMSSFVEARATEALDAAEAGATASVVKRTAGPEATEERVTVPAADVPAISTVRT